jgi:chloramphenicol O-acetyltransferase type A
MNFKYFDVANWGRKRAFEFYKKFDDPYFNLTANVEVSHLINQTKSQDQSFFLSTLHIALECVNQIDNFKMRIEGEKLRIYKVIHGGSTLFYDDESFGFGYYDYFENRSQFIKSASQIIEKCNAEKSFDPSATREDLIYFSSLPWCSFTSFKHAQDKSINSSIPRITFGKYFKSGNQTMLPINIEVHHALMDGYHLGLFFAKFQEISNNV